MTIETELGGLAVVWGLVIGSFLNVVIARLPVGMTLLGRSQCPRCAARIGWRDLVPVLSFLLLRGRCRHCRQHIAWRYPAVELATALLALAAVARFGPGLAALAAFAFGAALLVVTLVDLDHRIIPDAITLPGVALGILARGLAGGAWLPALLGALAGAGSLYAVAWLYRAATGREGLGLGDVKLAALLGACLGGAGVFLTIFLASVAGSLAGAVLMASGRGSRTTALPFGTFLAPVGLLVLFYGPQLIGWYVGTLARAAAG